MLFLVAVPIKWLLLMGQMASISMAPWVFCVPVSEVEGRKVDSMVEARAWVCMVVACLFIVGFFEILNVGVPAIAVALISLVVVFLLVADSFDSSKDEMAALLLRLGSVRNLSSRPRLRSRSSLVFWAV